ncbi:aspartyl-phosphate phosphatase Spo0E family protein [Sporolactobacillus shoreicorticis]|uniref:Spo0E family sporulation regulatory protein-aspartic acid phosphatase n=1 Tax=Sporolactobacillus shoreicorticis TaxID=1923877 RepID=A0ABW5S797_9BACL|nr:aspartyl-phosphate phosphatase Spo0E family protein [Sporolactobacillus shoreicorticis]MCO7126246.1 aspartyl-phosphate phosphatase Spo0E family protein [Sporolactobacillus shoreicorticis]
MSELSEVLISQEISSIYSEAVEKKRKNLLDTAKKYGLYAEQTLLCSQELDLMIVEIQEKCSPSSQSAQV